MSIAHKIYITLLSIIVLIALFLLVFNGYSYYRLPVEERFFSPDHLSLKPSGIWGHGFGILGSFLMLLGVVLYIARKRIRRMSQWGLLKHWLEFHIFLCTLGPILILFHTSFKFGGLVAVSFWSMVAVFASGVIGRFIYIQIPRSIEGRELSLNEVREMKSNMDEILSGSSSIDEETKSFILESTKKKVGLYQSNLFIGGIKNSIDDRKTISKVKKLLRRNKITKEEFRQIVTLVKNDISLNRRIDRLVLMQNLFKYWHVAHLPFAFVMLIIMIIHVAVTIVFGYKWIF